MSDTMANTVSWRVTIDGRDISSPLQPLLVSIEVVDKPGAEADAARMVLDDTDGQIKLPRLGAAVSIELEGVEVFRGVVDATPWSIARGSGRLLEVVCKAFDTRGKAKERQAWHLDDASLSDALTEAAKGAGFTIKVDPAFDAVRRDYWSMDHVSFLAYAERLAREHGATFKVQGTRAVFAKRGSGMNVAGAALPSVAAKVGRGGNVHSVRIDPTSGRPRFEKARVRYFDRASAEFREKDVEIAAEGGGAVNVSGRTVADEQEAEAFGEGRRIDAERESGVGTIEMELTPEARAEGTVVLAGARPGIDGTYRITSVTHRTTRDAGSLTTLELAQPQGEAGKDSRRATDVPIPTPRPAA